jgi:hypothetical protein
MTGKECKDSKFAFRNASWTLMGPEQPQNLETRGIFIHLWRSWRSDMAVVSLSKSGGVPDLLLGLEVAVKSAEGEEDATRWGIANRASRIRLPVGWLDIGPV